MTDHKLLKYLSKPFVIPVGVKQLTPVIFTDSKGKYLEPYCINSVENSIKWWSQSGRSSSQALEWLKQNLEFKIGHLDNIALYVWFGTCDLTIYDKHSRYINLRTETDDSIQTIVNNYQEIAVLLKSYPGCKLSFLETPPYSVSLWNSYQKHPDVQQFKNDDDILLKQIKELNNHIRYMNDTLGTRTPNLSADIQHRINTSNKNDLNKARNQYNFNLYKDGIHPTTNLAKVWLKKITQQIKIDCCKTAATDNVGNNVQITYSITDTTKKSFTINAYLTKCTLLINGKNSERFELCDITEIHSIMTDTKISGVKINIEKGNRKLAEQLEEAIATLQSGLGLAHASNSQTGVAQNTNQSEKCHKCKRNCRTKAVLCIYGHWVHYNCEKFSEDDVKNVKRKDFTYICTVCNLEKDDKNKIVNTLEVNGKQNITLAETLLQEENIQNCHACNMSILNKVDCCSICLMKFHNFCLNTSNSTCFACLGLKDQNDIVQLDITQDHQTCAKTIDTEGVSVGNKIDCSSTQHTEKKEENLTTNNTLSNINSSTVQDQSESSINSEFQKIKMKELRQLEQRLRKKDEQLKLKETAINESLSEKTKVLDRLFKAETRNLELEQTVKNLFTRIETLEAYKTTQGDGGTFHSIPNTENKFSPDCTSSDKLIVGIRDKVTNYVLGKVDEELNKLLNNSCDRSSNPEQFNPSQESLYQQKSYVQTGHQYSPNQQSNQQYFASQQPIYQYSPYGQPVFHNTFYEQPSHQDSNVYYQYHHIHNSEQEIETNHSVSFHSDLNDDRNICSENLIEILPTEQRKLTNLTIHIQMEQHIEMIKKWLTINTVSEKVIPTGLTSSLKLKLLNDILHNYNGIGKAVDSNDPITPWRMPRGYGGTAILWKKDLDSIVTR
ncbi:unnamed protein product [Mytilus coruscus]|uniref:Zinc finger PHD-type domain-containing protein n=1 Tax=Mytilus coruscus TaxID=42192 RepID=A0A6J8CW97_MYTCO|nr:unnamed protein product [Mytilus coruscus]